MADQRSALRVDGNVANDAVDIGDPIKIGGVAKTTATNVNAGDRTDAMFTLNGALVVAGLQGTTPTALAVDGSGGLEVVGNIAHDSADASSQPVKIGGRAQTTIPDVVADNDRVDALFDASGRQVVVSGGARNMQGRLRTTLTSATETTIAAATASEFHDLVMLTLSNESASEVRVDIRDTTGGTVLMSFDLAPDGGGAVIPFPTPFAQAAVNTNWTAQLSTAVSSVYITAIWQRVAG